MAHRNAVDWTLADIREVVANGEQENLLLEYKASPAIGDWTDVRRNELAKDICAFANAAGGIIIIGVGEVQHKPTVIDAGVDTRIASKEAVESALQARIAPRIDGLVIKEIPNPEREFFAYFVIGVPRSMRAPHMCNPFHRYYKRYNFESVPMEHYEVEDVRRRQSEPVLKHYLHLEKLHDHDEEELLYALHVGVVNEGSVTARDVLVRIYIPAWLTRTYEWEPENAHESVPYNGTVTNRFDVYIRDSAGPIPLYPKDDQPYLVTRKALRWINLAIPDGEVHAQRAWETAGTPFAVPIEPAFETPDLTRAHLIMQVFADGMRTRRFDVPLVNLLGGERGTNGKDSERGA